MFRSRLILSVSGPAALLALLAQPMVQQGADLYAPGKQVSIKVASARSVSPHIERAIAPVSVIPEAQRPRRSMRDGCEGAISSLAGPEARRMVPGRCIA